ncbi:acyltransferase family protein [Bradyrhizobium canariense]|uniref:Peptidoglycan/LPS O-acetylase OafA/YrhL, contains acyltransferase and SGNH-hydrolase domains n=1 Tax=Bradyrhizobium canariense TaxID=255045 RepID=A0A1H2BJR4_9BRAD|nr:acyltransferase [Bradyrhizobium canariense]SDT58317.1 Peptidoglycan/LPS O-acetylase OafA/YrhL, contains acyltransferase and SGNH-hydrolase domains [Bradyrhizobium canariense]
MLRGQALFDFMASLPQRIGRPTTRTAYIPQIDGLRFLAIAIVLLWHVSLRADRFVDYLNLDGQQVYNLYPWFPHGEVGVALFFFISGYVIAQPFLSRPPATWRIGRFYLQRLRRIYPPYVIAITICLLIVAAVGFGSATSNLPISHSWLASLFYLHGLVYDTSSRLNPPTWSLEIEIQFYLLAPLLIWLQMRSRHARLRTAVACVCIVLLIAAAGLFDFLRPFDGRFRYGLLAHMYLFVAGIVTADFVRMRTALSEIVSTRFDLLFAAGVLSLLLIGLYFTQVDAKPGGGWSDVFWNFALLSAVLASYFGAMHGRISRRLMGAPWVALIGTMCYSIYLVHIVVIEGVASVLLKHIPLHHPAAIYSLYIVVLIPASLFFGALFYVVVERPFMSAFAFESRLSPRQDSSGRAQ